MTTALPDPMPLALSGAGITALVLFVLAYLLVISEEFIGLRKSKSVIVAAGLIWALTGLAWHAAEQPEVARTLFDHNLLEYGKLLLFLLSAMTYINTMEERQVFAALRARLVAAGFSLRSMFWITGLLAFFISPVADNLTTALLMGAVTQAIGGSDARFIRLAFINIVVAANAGGAFSPFGDITTLMVWQAGLVPFGDFFALFLPAFVNWLVPAALMAPFVPGHAPATHGAEAARVKQGGLTVIGLFLLTLAMAVAFERFLHLPPVLGMMTGLGLLAIHGYRIRRMELAHFAEEALGFEDAGLRVVDGDGRPVGAEVLARHVKPRARPFDIFISTKRAEWDTLLFFYGVVLCVGGLGALGWLALASQTLYVGLGATLANVLVGLLSAVVDNIPVMYAVINMNPDMPVGQWLLVTLTAGVGGSLLSIGSAAGVGLMGQARGVYTFFAHLRWTPAIALGYAASVALHRWANAAMF